MDNIKTILTAIDFSHYTKSTLDYASVMARQMSAKLIIVNVINQRDINVLKYTLNHMDSLGSKMDIDSWIKEVQAERTATFEKAKNDIDLSNVEYELVFRAGFPFEELMKVIKDKKADLVVMGAKGRSDLTDFLVGSVANKMFRKCPVPIVSVRTDA